MSRLAVIIPAAGSGSRMGTHTPKPFLTLNGKTILEHTISAFAKVDEVVDIRIATSVDWFDQVEAILNKFADDVESASVIEGGDERQHSIFNALQSLDNSIDLIAVHDAVRPFVSAELIRKCAHRASEVGGAIVAVPAKDTIKKLGDGFEISETPDRSKLWQAQTPQVFRADLLLEAYIKAREDDFLGTDDASLVERIGGVVEVIEGDRKNLKITYPIDLKVAGLILNEEDL